MAPGITALFLITWTDRRHSKRILLSGCFTYAVCTSFLFWMCCVCVCVCYLLNRRMSFEGHWYSAVTWAFPFFGESGHRHTMARAATIRSHHTQNMRPRYGSGAKCPPRLSQVRVRAFRARSPHASTDIIKHHYRRATRSTLTPHPSPRFSSVRGTTKGEHKSKLSATFPFTCLPFPFPPLPSASEKRLGRTTTLYTTNHQAAVRSSHTSTAQKRCRTRNIEPILTLPASA